MSTAIRIEPALGSIDPRLDLEKEIPRLKKEMNAIILAHYYQEAEIQDLADFVGDSLGLAQQAAKTDASVIVFCGVHFMAETAKILSPEKLVVIPDLDAGCSLADRCPADRRVRRHASGRGCSGAVRRRHRRGRRGARRTVRCTARGPRCGCAIRRTPEAT